MIFDVKMEDFQCTARLVAGGHMTKVLKTLTYLSVVSCETVQIALTIAMLNDLEVRPQMCKMHSRQPLVLKLSIPPLDQSLVLMRLRWL